MLAINAAGINAFGVLAIDYSSLFNNSSLRFNSVTTSTLQLTLATSTVLSSTAVVFDRRRSDFCFSFPQYDPLCRGMHVKCIRICLIYILRMLDKNPAEFTVETKPVSDMNIL